MEIEVKLPSALSSFPTWKDRYIVLYGGRGSGKSWTTAVVVILRMLQEKVLVLCTREVQNTIKDSVHKLLSDTIERMKVSHLFEVKQTEIVCKNGSRAIFKGLSRNITEIKSTEGVDICWIEEGENISRESFDILIPTIRKPDSQFYIVFNPKRVDAPVYSDYVEKEHPQSKVVKVNYWDNPFFPDVLRTEMEFCRESDYDRYLHIWEGQPQNITDACVFKGKFEVRAFESPKEVHFFYGADWGFSNDPSCLIRSFIHEDYLWIDQEAYGVGVELDELDQLFSHVSGAKENKPIADNSRPDTISFLNRKYNWCFSPSKKGKNSIEDGVEFMKSFKKIIIHPRCKNVEYEFMNYSYKTDKLTGDILPIIIDANNHCIDAIRYSLEDIRRGSSGNVHVAKYKLSEILYK